MPKTGIIDELAAHQALDQLPEAWLELAYGRIGTDEAIASVQEPAALVERTARMLVPPSAAHSEARLARLLEAHAPAEPRLRARSRRWSYGGVAALVAAAMVLLLLVPRGPSPAPFAAGYELELGRALASERDVSPGEADADPRYRMDRTVELVLRPSRRVSEVLDVRAFARRGDEAAIVLPIEPRANATGVIEILGQPRAWGLEPGRWRLTLVVGPAAGLPDAPADLESGPDAPYEVREAWIVVLDEAAPAP